MPDQSPTPWTPERHAAARRLAGDAFLSRVGGLSAADYLSAALDEIERLRALFEPVNASGWKPCCGEHGVMLSAMDGGWRCPVVGCGDRLPAAIPGGECSGRVVRRRGR